MTQYQKISKKIDELEKIGLESSTGITLSQWCSDQITWAYKWHKIDHNEMTHLCDRMIKLYEGDYNHG